MNKQIDRISEMENQLDELISTQTRFSNELEIFGNAQQLYENLSKYYSSNDWRKDFDDDANNKIPKEIKRGVLSEDAIYDALNYYKQLCTETIEKLQEILNKL